MNKTAKVVQYQFKDAHTYAELLQDFLDNAKNIDVVEAEEVYQLIDEAFKCAFDAMGTVNVLKGDCAKLIKEVECLKKTIADLVYYIPRQNDEIYEIPRQNYDTPKQNSYIYNSKYYNEVSSRYHWILNEYYRDDYCNRLFHPTCNKDAHY